MLSYRGTGATALPQEATPWQYLKDGKWTPSSDIIIYNLINVGSKVEANVEKGKNKLILISGSLDLFFIFVVSSKKCVNSQIILNFFTLATTILVKIVPRLSHLYQDFTKFALLKFIYSEKASKILRSLHLPFVLCSASQK